jgi:hypothetical protein
VQQNKAVVKSSRDIDGAVKTSPRRQQQEKKSETGIRGMPDSVLLRWRDLCVAASVPCGEKKDDEIKQKEKRQHFPM